MNDLYKDKPLVSVVMSVYNESNEEIIEAIESIIQQTYPNIEFIIVCDNPFESRIIELLNQYANKYNQIQVIFNKVNIGLALSLNKGIMNANGDYIARMDSDDISETTRIEKEMHLLMKNRYDMITSNSDYINEVGEKTGDRDCLPVKNSDIKMLLPLANFICHPSIIIKKQVIEKLGMYRVFKVSEDYDLWLRLLSSGYIIGTTNEVLLHYRIRSESLSSKNAIKRIVYIDYQKKLYRERLKTGKDSYSLEKVKILDNQLDIYINDSITSKMIDGIQTAISDRKIILFIRNYLEAIIKRKKIIVSWSTDLIKYKFIKLIKKI